MIVALATPELRNAIVNLPTLFTSRRLVVPGKDQRRVSGRMRVVATRCRPRGERMPPRIRVEGSTV